MNLKPLHIVSVGRPRAVFWRDAANYYMERLGRWRAVKETVIKDADPALPAEQKKQEEGRRILNALSERDIVICLDEKGRGMKSRDFSRFLDELSGNATRCPCFVLGGAFGLSGDVLDSARHLISFGPQTLPHELARVVLLEQLCRAESLIRNLPYHHD